MGHIIGAFGIHGWVKIKTDAVHSLSNYPKVLLKQNEQWSEYKLEKVSTANDVLQVKLENINDRNQALALKGTVVGIERSEFPALANDEYYFTDLIDLNVYNQKHEFLGQVKNLMETGATAVLVLQDGDKERLIPFVNKYIINVDLQNKQIIVDWELDY